MFQTINVACPDTKAYNWYHSQTNIILWDSPFKQIFVCEIHICAFRDTVVPPGERGGELILSTWGQFTYHVSASEFVSNTWSIQANFPWFWVRYGEGATILYIFNSSTFLVSGAERRSQNHFLGGCQISYDIYLT